MAQTAVPGAAFVKGRERIIRFKQISGSRPSVSVDGSFIWTVSPAVTGFRYLYGLTQAEFTPTVGAQEFYLIGGSGWRDAVGTIKSGQMQCNSYFIRNVSGGAVEAKVDAALADIMGAETNPDTEFYVEEFNYLGTQAASGTIPVGTDLTITEDGADYTVNGIFTNVPAVAITGTGAGAKLNIAIAGGVVVAAEVVAPGSGYANGDTLRVAYTDLGMANAPTTQMILTIPGSTVASGTGYVYHSRAFVGHVQNVSQPAPADNLVSYGWTFVSRGEVYVGKRVEASAIVLPAL